MSYAVRPVFCAVTVCPIVPADRRVICLDVPKQRAAAHGGLQDVTELRTACKLVFFFKMSVTDITERDLDTLDLHGIVRASEHDPLPGRLIDEVKRVLFRVPKLRYTQRAHGPNILSIDRIAQGVTDFSEHKAVNIFVFHNQADADERRP